MATVRTESATARFYIDEARLPYPFCPGCGHGRILDALDAALGRLGRDPRQVVIVTDIGCVGLSDQYFVTNGFHGLHGRSVTYATGIKLANPELTVVVLIGDGGCGIGGHHLIHAARRNVGVTVLVFNNFNFGMTGGEHSVLTPLGSVTATTRDGNLEFPMDVAATMAVNGAAFVARTTSFDPALTDLIYEALSTDGFSLLDIWELCTAYFVPNNHFSRKLLEQTLARSGMQAGVVARRQRPEYSRAVRQAPGAVGQADSRPGAGIRALEPKFASPLRRRCSVVIAGAAGQKVRSTATLLGRSAVLSGLFATQRDDYPVTIMTGHSISELVLSPEPIGYTGIPVPDVMIVLAPEGAGKVTRQLAGMGPDGRVYVEASLHARVAQATRAQVVPLQGERLGRRSVALAAVAAVAEREGWVSVEALLEACELEGRAEVAQEMRQAILSRGQIWQ